MKQQQTTKRFRNYHTHTMRCQHAEGSDEAYVHCAIEAGYDVLGFADHSPWPNEQNGFHSAVRMREAEFPEYTASIRSLREKYKNEIEIQIGLECEYYPQFYSWLKEQKDAFGLDYLILGNHFARSDEQNCHFSYTTTPDMLMQYVDTSIAGMETGLFAYLAHPDVVFASYPIFDKACEKASRLLCEASLAFHFPLEYNLLGLVYAEAGRYQGLGYPCRQFWRIAGSMGCTVIVGVDAHDPTHLTHTDRIMRGQKLLTDMGADVIDVLVGKSQT